MTPTFVQRVLTTIHPYGRPVVFVAERAWGTPYLFQELVKREETCVWCDLAKEDADDPVVSGNRLADALSRALGCQVVGYGMPYSYGVAVLREHLRLFAPLTLILSGAEFGQDLARDLVGLQGPGVEVVLEFQRLPDRFLISEDALVVRSDDLRLTPAEAGAVVADRLNEIETLNLLRLAGGAYETFLLELHKRLNLPPKLRPHPKGAAPPPGAATALPPDVFLRVLERRRQWVEALEAAAEHAPERVPELLSKAGAAYLERGRYEGLAGLLEALPGSVRDDERVLFWRLRAAKRLGCEERLRETVARHLKNHEAPDLRALYASQLPEDQGFREAERAYEAAKTFTTLQHYGNALACRDPQRSLEVFRELVLLTEEGSRPVERATAAVLFAHPLSQLSRYREAAAQLEKALTVLDEAGVGDWQLRLHTFSNLAYTRILIGETAGLREGLEREVKALQAAFPTLAAALRSTLGDYLLSQGEAEAALGYHLENLALFADQSAARHWEALPYLLYSAVQALLHSSLPERAGALARKYMPLLNETPGHARTYARLAYGMVLSFTEPAEAVAPLEEACRDLRAALKGDHLVSACFYLAKAHLSLGNKGEAKAALARCKTELIELSETGFRLLAGPQEEFHEIKVLWQGREAPLRLTFLGMREVWLHDERLELFPQLVDILALLARHPEGLSPEALLLLLYGDRGKLGSLKAMLSKLRRHVPVTRSPYRLDIAFQADFLMLERYVRKGHLRAGLELYKGPLLPKSDALGVREMRNDLEELLRQAALASQDPEALLSLSERFKEDLELWEASLEALPEHDPRRAVAAAKHKSVLEAW